MRDQERDQGNRDQSRKNTGSKKGNIQGYTEIGDRMRTRQRRGKDEDEVAGWLGDKVMR